MNSEIIHPKINEYTADCGSTCKRFQIYYVEIARNIVLYNVIEKILNIPEEQFYNLF